MNGNKMLEAMFEEQDAISYDADEDRFVFTMLEDIGAMWNLYDTNPMFREFVDRELRAKREMLYDLNHDTITGYEVLGFLYRHQGEEYTLPREIF